MSDSAPIDSNPDVDGICRPLSAVLPAGSALARPATDFSRPVVLHTNKAESQWLGSLLLYLSAQGGEWRAVPWRMLRNMYMGFDAFERTKRRGDLRLPKAVSTSMPVVYVSNESLPIEELLIGLSHMMQKGLVKTFSDEREDYLIPTDNLISCVRSQTTLPYDEVVYGPVVHVAPPP